MKYVSQTIGLAALSFAGTFATAAPTPAVQRNVLYTAPLTNVPGETLTAVALDIAPGAKSSAKHHHAGTVLVYVISGAVRVQFEGGGPKLYQTGQYFTEPPGTEHLSTENVSATAPAKLLAVFVAGTGAKLTTYDE